MLQQLTAVTVCAGYARHDEPELVVVAMVVVAVILAAVVFVGVVVVVVVARPRRLCDM